MNRYWPFLYFLLCPILVSTWVSDPFIPLKYGFYLMGFPLCGWLFAVHQKPKPLVLNSFDYTLGGLMVTMGVSILWSTNWVSALEYYSLWLGGGIIYLLLRIYQPSYQDLRIWGVGYLVACALNTIYGWIQYFELDPYHLSPDPSAISALIGNPNMVSQVILIGTVFLLGKFFQNQSNGYKWLFGVLVLIEVLFLVILKTRASWLALIVVFSLFLYVSLKDKSPRYSLFYFWGTLGLLGTVAMTWLTYIKSSKTIYIRSITYLNSLALFKDFPQGVGLDNFKEFYPLYYQSFKPDPLMTMGQMMSDPHNDFLRMFVETGVFGGGLALFLVFLVVRVPVSSINEITIVKFALIGVFVNGLFSFPLKHPQILSVVFVGVAILANDVAGLQEVVAPRPIHRIFKAVCAVFMIGLTLQGGAYVVSRHLFQESIALVVDGKPLLAQKALVVATKLSPSYFRAQLQLVSSYREQNQFQSALDIVNRVLQLAPNHWTFLYTKANLLIELNRFEEAQYVLARAQTIMPYQSEL